jgi:hypothetical protein
VSQQELWATYSVEDHKKPRTLAADILLFDRLVFPVPESAHFPENSGPPDSPGPVQWTPDPKERARWKSKGWDPDSQDKLLSLLAPGRPQGALGRAAPRAVARGTASP